MSDRTERAHIRVERVMKAVTRTRSLLEETLSVVPVDTWPAVRSVFDRWAGERHYIATRPAARRRELARAMLSNGMRRESVQRVIVERFKVSIVTARRDVQIALASRSTFASKPIARPSTIEPQTSRSDHDDTDARR